MPSARALLVASLLTEPPYGCLGPSGNDRYRKRSQTVVTSQVNCQVAAALSHRIGRADVFGQALWRIYCNDPNCILSRIAAITESLVAWKLGPGNQRHGDHEQIKREGKIKALAPKRA
jgi:hypothetical protein